MSENVKLNVFCNLFWNGGGQVERENSPPSKVGNDRKSFRTTVECRTVCGGLSVRLGTSLKLVSAGWDVCHKHTPFVPKPSLAIAVSCFLNEKGSA